MKKSLKIIIPAFRIISFIALGLFLFISCSTTKEAACPEFRDSRNYSTKYRVDYKTNRKYTKNQSLKRTVKAETYIFIITRSTNKFSVDFTINQNEIPEYESFRLMPFPNRPSGQIQNRDKER